MQKPERPSPEARSRQHLLVVDDEAPIRQVLKSHLSKQGYQVATAATAAETLRLTNLLPIDLVILDVVLEDADGLDLLAKLKKSQPQRPVIIITGLADDGEVQRRALERGAFECVSKILSLDQLSATIERALSTMPQGGRMGNSGGSPRRVRRPPPTTPALSLKAHRRRTGVPIERQQRSIAGDHRVTATTKAAAALVEQRPQAPAIQAIQAESPAPIWEADTAPGQTPRVVAAETFRADPGAVAQIISVAPKTDGLKSVVEVFLRMLGGYHPNLANTAMRAVFLCRTLGQMLPLPPAHQQILLWAAALHDISLIEIDRGLVNRWLRSTEKCTKQEIALLKRHPERSQRMLDFCPAFNESGEIIRAHHEHWDGSGYPGRLRMEMIPWLARLLSVVIAYCSKHSPNERTLAEIKAQANRLYDLRAVEAVVKAAEGVALPAGERELTPSALKPGMVLAGDLFNWRGVLIVGRGTELNQARITKIVHFTETGQTEPRILVCC
ncbi:MAG: response regulator [Verrucomicrobia bacterium]|nr:response regulator [Verrucomicrobiota bacterium]